MKTWHVGILRGHEENPARYILSFKISPETVLNASALQSCAESKIKCNLEYPCAKCVSRGRECVYLNDPEVSRNKKGESRNPSSSSQPVEDVTPPSPSLSPGIHSRPPEDSSVTSTPSSHFFSLPTLSESDVSSAESSMPCSPQEEFQTFSFDEQPLNYPFDVGRYEDLAAVLSPISPFDQPPFPCQPPPSSLFDSDEVTVAHHAPEVKAVDLQSLTVDDDLDLFASLMHPPSPPVASSSTARMTQPPITLDYLDALDMQYLSASNTTLEAWYRGSHNSYFGPIVTLLPQYTYFSRASSGRFLSFTPRPGGWRIRRLY